MRLLLAIAMIASMLFAADAAYALGGGGSQGDGRQDFSQSAGNGGASPTNSNAQGPPNTNNVNTGGTDNDPAIAADSVGVSLPEPVAAFLLGLGMVGLAGLRKKFRK